MGDIHMPREASTRAGAQLAMERVCFLLQLCALGALSYWGWHTGDSVRRVVLAVGAPAALAGSWGTWVAPGSPKRLEDPLRFAIEVVIYCGAGVALIGTGQIILGVALGVMGVADAFVLRVYAISQIAIDKAPRPSARRRGEGVPAHEPRLGTAAA